MDNQDQSNKLFDSIYKLINGIDLKVSRRSLIKFIPLICCFLIVLPVDSSEGLMNPRKESPAPLRSLPRYSQSSTDLDQPNKIGIAKVVATYKDCTTVLLKVLSPSEEFPVRFSITLECPNSIPRTMEYTRVE